jgi:allantoate deiminase
MHNVHALLRHWMESAGLTVRVDPAGNLIGHRSANWVSTDSRVAPDAPQILLIGSHLDTVPNAGKFDGILGVLIGLAVVEATRDLALPFAVEVIGFSEEEGVRFSLPYIGSRTIAGSFEPQWLERKDENGVSLRDAITAFGLDADRIPSAAYDPTRVLGFVEAHIEQGPVLERAGLPVAAVTSIVGQSRLVVHFRGEAGHAGTMPMELRRDALVGAAKWIQTVQTTGRAVEGLRATVGRIASSPNASNVIPDQVELSLDVRHASNAVRLQAIETLLEAGRRIADTDELSFEVIQRGDSDSVSVCPRLEWLMSDCIEAQGAVCADSGRALRMASGAGHDAVIMGSRFPMAMLFIRHPGGISHHPDERVDQADVQIAIDVLVDFIKRLADQENKK